MSPHLPDGQYLQINHFSLDQPLCLEYWPCSGRQPDLGWVIVAGGWVEPLRSCLSTPALDGTEMVAQGNFFCVASGKVSLLVTPCLKIYDLFFHFLPKKPKKLLSFPSFLPGSTSQFPFLKASVTVVILATAGPYVLKCSEERT